MYREAFPGFGQTILQWVITNGQSSGHDRNAAQRPVKPEHPAAALSASYRAPRGGARLRGALDAEESTHYFLKTVIPSRKATRDYLGKEGPDEET